MYCKFCGKKINITEDICDDCKNLYAKSHKKKTNIFIIIAPCIVVLLLSCIIVFINSSNKDLSTRYSNNSPYNKENNVNETIETTPKLIYDDFDNNKISAKSKYKDKNISITGKIYVIAEDSGNPSIGLVNSDDKYKTTIPEVYCSFANNNQNDKIVKLYKGQIVTIEGVLDMSGISIYIKNCKLK
jgi:predicted nucleic acid-binding Zn ribbon protein